MSNKNIEKLGFDYAQNQGTNYPVEEIYRSMIWKQIKEAFIEGFNAALQNKESEVNECYFMPDKKGTSLTICVNCGKEKSLHTIGEGITASKVIYQTTDPSTEQSTYNWQAVGDKDKFLDEVRGKESDVSTEEIELESQRRYAILERYNNIDSFMKREAFKDGAEWYASIVNKKESDAIDTRVFLAEYIQQLILKVGPMNFPSLKDAIKAWDETMSKVREAKSNVLESSNFKGTHKITIKE